MALTIWQAYDKSLELMRKGELMEAAIFHALQYDINYPHDAQAMLLHWHSMKVPGFDHSGYPLSKSA